LLQQAVSPLARLKKIKRFVVPADQEDRRKPPLNAGRAMTGASAQPALQHRKVDII
jgi:hypothetical protein